MRKLVIFKIERLGDNTIPLNHRKNKYLQERRRHLPFGVLYWQEDFKATYNYFRTTLQVEQNNLFEKLLTHNGN